MVLPLLAQRLDEAAPASRVGNPGPTVLRLWLALHIAPSHFLLPLLCISLLLQRARRNLLLVNVALTWCISGFSSSLLLYAGKQQGPEPSKLLCLTQASLLYAIPPLTSTAVCSLVLSVWINLCWKRGERTRPFYLTCMLVVPYVVFFAFATGGAVLASRNPVIVSRSRRFFYCSINDNVFSGALAVYAAVVLLLTMVLNVWIGLTVWRNNRIMRRAMVSPPPPFAAEELKQKKVALKPDDIQFVIRLGIFAVYIVLGLTLSLLSIVAPTSPVPDVVFATMGLAVFLVFGTQPKLWQAWRDLLRPSRKQGISHIPTLTPFQLEPLPGEAQADGRTDTPPPPLPEKDWIEVSTRPPPRTYNLVSDPRAMATTSRVPASRFHVRPDSTTHPDSAPAIFSQSRMRESQTAVLVSQPIVPERKDGTANGAAARSYSSSANLFVGASSPPDDQDLNGLAPAAASYQSQYMSPLVEGAESFIGTGFATINTSDSGRSRSENDTSLQQKRQERVDPVIPRY